MTMLQNRTRKKEKKGLRGKNLHRASYSVKPQIAIRTIRSVNPYQKITQKRKTSNENDPGREMQYSSIISRSDFEELDMLG